MYDFGYGDQPVARTLIGICLCGKSKVTVCWNKTGNPLQHKEIIKGHLYFGLKAEHISLHLQSHI
jgi:hypothetical protein